VIGILEVFSDQPNAFSDAHITLLKKLAQIAVTSRARSVKAVAVQTAPLETAPLSRPPAPEQNLIVLPPPPERDPFAFLPARMRGEEGQPLRLAAAAVLLLVLGIAGWMVSRTRSAAAHPAQPVRAASQSASEVLAANSSGTAASPASAITSSPQPASTITLAGPSKPRPDVVAGDVVHKAATSVVVDRTPPASSAADSTVTSAAPSSPSPSTADSDAPAPDPAQVLSGSTQALPQSVINPQPVFPFVAVPVSQGVTGGRVMRRVDPFYPNDARVKRIEGAVTLDALVGEDGRVKQVQVTSGPPTLARAAAEAVRQWRYEPYLLNGKPVAIHNQITIQFKLP
jgi:periplasmic protein TonB